MPSSSSKPILSVLSSVHGIGPSKAFFLSKLFCFNPSKRFFTFHPLLARKVNKFLSSL